MLAAAINEAAYMIEEGICDRPQDMDLAMIYGTGFPPYRGRDPALCRSLGGQERARALVELEASYGPRFKPAKLIAGHGGRGPQLLRRADKLKAADTQHVFPEGHRHERGRDCRLSENRTFAVPARPNRPGTGSAGCGRMSFWPSCCPK